MRCLTCFNGRYLNCLSEKKPLAEASDVESSASARATVAKAPGPSASVLDVRPAGPSASASASALAAVEEYPATLLAAAALPKGGISNIFDKIMDYVKGKSFVLSELLSSDELKLVEPEERTKLLLLADENRHLKRLKLSPEELKIPWRSETVISVDLANFILENHHGAPRLSAKILAKNRGDTQARLEFVEGDSDLLQYDKITEDTKAKLLKFYKTVFDDIRETSLGTGESSSVAEINGMICGLERECFSINNLTGLHAKLEELMCPNSQKKAELLCKKCFSLAEDLTREQLETFKTTLLTTRSEGDRALSEGDRALSDAKKKITDFNKDVNPFMLLNSIEIDAVVQRISLFLPDNLNQRDLMDIQARLKQAKPLPGFTNESGDKNTNGSRRGAFCCSCVSFLWKRRDENSDDFSSKRNSH